MIRNLLNIFADNTFEMPTYLLAIYIVIFIILVAFSFMYSFSDATYSSANRLRLKREADEGNKKAAAALKLVDNFDFTIATILFGNDFVNILASSLAAVIGVKIFAGVFSSDDISSLITSIVSISIILIFGEILPKTLARKNPVKSAKAFVWFMNINKVIFFPFVWPINWLTQKMAKPLVDKKDKEEDVASDEELEVMVDEILDEGLIDEDQSEIIQNSIDFKDTSCYEIMTPRVKIFAYDLNNSFQDFIKDKNAFVHSRIPVCKGGLDKIVGYIQAKTVLRAIVSGKKFDIKDYIIPIVSVPRTMEISSALAIMKKNKNHICLIRDEFGGTEGILTLEDILEELVGEMWDEQDKVSDDIVKGQKRNVYLVRAEMSVDDFFDFFDLEDEKLDDDYATVSGWITDKLGRFPEVGDHFTYEKIDLYVTEVENYHVISATVKYHPRRKVKKN